PHTAYAADFIGAANLLKIDGVNSQDECSVVNVAGGAFTVANPAPSGPCQLAVRPEHIHLHTTPGDAAERVQATVLHRRYLGYKATYALRLADGQTVNADISAATDPQLSPDTQVY